MSDDDKSEASSIRSDDEDSDTEEPVENFKNKKLVLPPGVKAPYAEDDDGELSEEEETEESDDDDDLSDEGEYTEENAAEEVFTKAPEKQKAKRNKKTREEDIEISYDLEDDDNDDAEDDDEDGEKYLQKFDEFTKNSAIEQYHPELTQHNHDEIDTLSEIVRDGDGNIIDPLHITLPFLTKYERARILGERAKQLDAGATALVAVEDGLIDSYLIALVELEQKKIPFIVKRPLPNGGCEYWRLKDLEVI